MKCTTFKPINIPDFRELYDICTCGEHVRSKRLNNKLMTVRVDSGGIVKETNLSTVGGTKKQKYKIHILMGLTYITGYNPEKHDIVHIDGNKGNNNLQNLKIQDKNTLKLDCITSKITLLTHPILKELYQVCRCGQHIVSNKTNKVLSQHENNDGYKQVGLIIDNESKTFKVHQLVAHTFLKKPDDYNETKYVIDHINRKRDDNRLENLRFATVSENNLNTCESKIKKPILQYVLDGTSLVREYESIMDIIKCNPAMSSSGICTCLKNDIMKFTAYNYRWCYKNPEDKNIKYTAKDGEIFKDIIDVNYYNVISKKWELLNYPDYSISNFGNLINKKRQYLLGSENGVIHLSKNKIRKSLKIYNLTAIMFLDQEQTEEKAFIRFKDGNDKNSNVNNLEWVTYKDLCITNVGNPVIATDKDDNEINFKSVSEAVLFLEKENNDSAPAYGSGIRGCLSGYQETAYGYKWKYI